MPSPHPNPDAGATQGPLAPEHLRALADARQSSSSIRRTVFIARASSWTTGVFGGFAVLGGLLGDWIGLLLGIGVVIVAVREHRFAKRLAAFDPLAPRALAWNQLALGAIVVLYALASSARTLATKNLFGSSSGDKQVDAMMEGMSTSMRWGIVAFYGIVGVGGALATAAMACYYLRRAERVRRFIATTPPWVLQAFAAGM